jgi:succinate dehydrogenase/fumarate reductase flavoprotein subunit
VIVVGTGAAGLTAALTATLAGNKKVLAIEKTKWFGGTSAYSGGALWVPMNQVGLAAGFHDSPGRAETYLRNYLKDDYDDSAKTMVAAYLESAPEMVKFLEHNSATQFVAAPTPDYYMQLDGACKAGRTVLNAPYDGRRLGKMVKQIRYPLQGYCAFGSLQVDLLALNTWREPFRKWANFSAVTRGVLRYALDRVRWGKGTVLCNGNALVGRLIEKATASGIVLWNNAPAKQPLLENGRVTGMVINKDGREMRVRARQGVILATGGFARSSELSRKYLSNPDWTVSPRGNVGDGMRFGLASGGNLPAPLGENAALWSPISILLSPKGPARSYPHFATAITKPGSIMVDSNGKRFANEAASYQDLGRATHEAGVRVSYLIGDKTHLRKYGMGMALPGGYPIRHLIQRGYLIKAPTITALAQRLGMDADSLSATIERFNGFARKGKDQDFGRGDGSFDQAYGDFEVKPNPSLAPLEKGPFYALTLYSGNGITMYGLDTNKEGQVLKASGEPVPGLYAIGADQNHFLKGRYPSGGLTLGPSMVFGYRAGLHIAK